MDEEEFFWSPESNTRNLNNIFEEEFIIICLMNPKKDDKVYHIILQENASHRIKQKLGDVNKVLITNTSTLEKEVVSLDNVNEIIVTIEKLFGCSNVGPFGVFAVF